MIIFRWHKWELVLCRSTCFAPQENSLRSSTRWVSHKVHIRLTSTDQFLNSGGPGPWQGWLWYRVCGGEEQGRAQGRHQARRQSQDQGVGICKSNISLSFKSFFHLCPSPEHPDYNHSRIWWILTTCGRGRNFRQLTNWLELVCILSPHCGCWEPLQLEMLDFLTF